MKRVSLYAEKPPYRHKALESIFSSVEHSLVFGQGFPIFPSNILCTYVMNEIEPQAWDVVAMLQFSNTFLHIIGLKSDISHITWNGIRKGRTLPLTEGKSLQCQQWGINPLRVSLCWNRKLFRILISDSYISWLFPKVP